eukprot:9449187-Pyramimonas_sp.AAC.1
MLQSQTRGEFPLTRRASGGAGGGTAGCRRAPRVNSPCLKGKVKGEVTVRFAHLRNSGRCRRWHSMLQVCARKNSAMPRSPRLPSP